MIEEWLKSNIGYEIYNPNLNKLQIAYKSLKLNFEHAKIITIAGTNGKGQCSRLLFNALKERHQVSLWTSPHVYSACERIKNNSGDISAQKFLSSSTELKKSLESIQIKLSYFEFLFLLFLKESQHSDFLILEVGLGGRLDATNILDADYALITSISRDHQVILGNSYQKILSEKLGIVKDKTKLFTALELSYLRSIVKKKYSHKRYTDLFENKIIAREDDFITRNKKLVKSLLEELGENVFISELNDQHYFNQNYTIGQHQVFLSPAHNPDGARKLVQFLKNGEYNYDYILISFSKRSCEDAIGMIKSLKLLTLINAKIKIVICSFTHLKAMDRHDLINIAKKCECEFVDNSEIFFSNVKKESNILCCGSNYFLSNMLESLSGSR